MTAPVYEAAALREAFSGFPVGVVAIAATVDEKVEVLVASSFTVGVSQDPPLVLFAVQHTSTTWPILRSAPRLGVSVLGEGHAGSARQLATKDRERRLEGVHVRMGAEGAVLLEEAPIWLECSIWDTHPAGDHDVVVLRIEDLRVDFRHRPLIWHRSAFAGLSALAI